MNKKVRPIILKPLTDLDTEEQLKVRELRNKESVRKWMFSDHFISLDEHLKWIDRLRRDQSQIIFIAMDIDHTILGQAGITSIDRTHKKADITIYMLENVWGVPPAVEIAVIDFAFDTLGLDKINCETVEGNDIVVSSLKKILFKEEGFRRSQVVKHGKRLGVHLLGVTRQEWQEGRNFLAHKYHRMLTRFPVEVLYSAKEDDQPSIVDQIQEARARNNLNWMNLLRLALDKSPERTKELVNEIRQMDRKINELTEKLANDL